MATIAYSALKCRARAFFFPIFRIKFLAIYLIVFWMAVMAQIRVNAYQDGGESTVLISEVFYDTPGVDIEREWIEIINITDQTINLSGYKIGDEEQFGGTEGMVQFPPETYIEPGEALVIAQNALGFRQLFDGNPDFEIVESDPDINNMRPYLQWANGQLALANDGDEILLLDGMDRIIDSLNYGNSLTFFKPGTADVISGHSLERVPANCDTDLASDWQAQRDPTPGEVRLGDCPDPIFMADPHEQFLSIGAIQGAGERSPRENQVVKFRGVVTGVFADRNQAGITYHTLFVQDIPGFEDGDIQTSDGIAVFLGQQPSRFQKGDYVEISGQVTEFFGLTEIDDRGLDITLVSSNNTLPDPITIDPPGEINKRASYLETKEGMLVQTPGRMKVIGPTHIGCEFAVAPEQFSGRPIKQHMAETDPDGLVLVAHYTDVACQDFPAVKTNDTVSGIRGPLNFHFDRFKIVQQAGNKLAVDFATWPPFLTAPPLGAAQFSIATINLQNYFDDVWDTANPAEPVVKAAVLSIKQQKIASLIGNTLNCPTIVAVQEVENEALLQALVLEIAKYCDFRYQVNHRESADSRGLDLGLLTEPDRVKINNIELRQHCTDLATGVIDKGHPCPANLHPLFSRPPLLVDLLVNGHPYQIIVNHFKSKLGGENETAPRRLAQAEHVWEMVIESIKADPHAKIIALGDFNDYEQSPPLARLMASGALINALEKLPVEDRYTYIYDGLSQLIDFILVTPAVHQEIAAVRIFHVNADYPYQLDMDPSPAKLPYRSSDHDPILLVINNRAGEMADLQVPGRIQTPLVQELEPAGLNNSSIDRNFIWLLGVIIILLLFSTIYLFKRSVKKN